MWCVDPGFDSSRPWVAVLVEPSAPRPANRRQQVSRLCLQVKGLSIAQFPNPPLAVAIVARVLARRASGRGREIVEALAAAALAAWAYGELSAGTNRFRRVLGALALARTAAQLATRHGAPSADPNPPVSSEAAHRSSP